MTQNKINQDGAQKELFRQDNMPSHKSTITMAKLYELNFNLIPLGAWTRATSSSSQTWISGYFFHGTKKLETRWTKRIARNED